ncbi:MAG: FtsB family cell division protein [Janthinobacterium lividum]
MSSPHHARRNRFHPKAGSALRSRVGPWRRRAATVVAGALALGMAYGVMFGHNGLTAFARKRQEEQTLRLQTQQLQRDNARLQGHVERLENDPSAIEHQAREELHYTRAGEVIYTLPESVSPKTQSVPNE